MKQDEKTAWNRRYSERSHCSLEPDPFLVNSYTEFVAGSAPGIALDVAGGVGRHSLWLAERGWQVKLADISEVGIDLAKKNIAARIHSAIPGGLDHQSHSRFTIDAQVQDLQTNKDLGTEQYDLVLVFFYLQRSLFPALISALKPGGFLLYKTYTLEQQRFQGGPSHPLHLLKPNELLHAFHSLRILYYRETLQNKGVAELVAQQGT